ncbi:MAG: class I mannose-6-phosphate isomerase [Oscillospiraceae bacterium]|nr:class I mannose-6-phosphate isomerase [Oscillospiraceae bacterium]
MSGLKPIFLEPVLQEKLWGGDRLGTQFGYAIPSSHTGECWAISAHPSGDCRVKNPEYAGKTLGDLWRERRDLFGNVGGDVFPLLIKIIDARDDLSIQVHPDDAYARTHESGALGKTECWYVLDCDEGASIIIGHNAGSPEQLREMVEQGRWPELLRQVPIRKGDFFQIDPGCLHAIKGGTLILETQQSSDVTYRFYDYGRLENGKPRTLHIEQSLAVTQAPFRPHAIHRETVREGGAQVTRLVACPYYTVYRVEVDGLWERDWNRPFVNVSVIGGQGVLDGQEIRTGDHLLLPAGYGKMTIEGSVELICSHL